MPTETIKTKLEDFVTHSTELGESAIKLARIKVVQKTTDISAKLFLQITVAVLSMVVVLFLSIAAALWIGNLLQATATGFVIVGLFYLLLLIILLLSKNSFILPGLRNRIVKKMYE